MAVHFVALILFHVGWALFMLSEASRMGGEASPACDNEKDFDTLSGMCNGYAAGTVFCIFAFVAALAAAGYSKKGANSWYPFMVGVIFYALAKVCETGGLSEFYCDSKVDVSELCKGYTAAAVFYFFAFFSAIVVLALMWKWAESRHFSLTTWFVFLAWFAVGVLCELGGLSAYYCGLDKTNVKEIDDANKSQCSGFGFAAFVMAMAMVAGVTFAALTFMKQNTGSNLWMGFTIWFTLYLFAYVVNVGTLANVNCNIQNDTKTNDYLCNGYGFATAFSLFAVLTGLATIFFIYRGHEGFKQLFFLATFSFFYLAYTCYAGGQSAAGCNEADDVDDDGYPADSANGRCSGFGAATFFDIVAFLLLGITAGLTLTNHAAPQPEDGNNNSAEKDVPSAVATPVASAVPSAPSKGEGDDGADV